MAANPHRYNGVMGSWLDEYRIFWREFRSTFHTTGAVLPSGKNLCRALARQVGRDSIPRRVLEVGPGTGAVTTEIIRRLGPDDRLDLVELNPRFAETLRERLANEASWQRVANRVRVLEMPIEQLPTDEKYECIVSGLPLNNFSCDFVGNVLAHFHKLAAEGCTLSFFEYVAIRKAKALVSSASERERLNGIGKLLQEEFDNWEFDRQCVLANVPPAWVHHLRFAQMLPSTEPVTQLQPAVS
jgi:phosphatidylethanolamine/phosphatidyl-N-methylethanolamine N-methyltransferase